MITITAFLAGSAVIAQSGLQKQGSQLYADYDYTASVRYLEAVDEKNDDDLRKLADSYDFLENYQKAEEYRAKVIQSSGKVARDYIEYARVLMKNGKYDLAEQQLKIYETLHPEDIEIQRYQLLNESLSKYSQYGDNFTVSNMAINSDHQDFAPVIFEGKLFFTSTRSDKTKFVHRRWNGNKMPFLDMYVADQNAGSATAAEMYGDKKLNKKYHDGPMVFNHNGNELFITSSNYDSKATDGTRNFFLLTSTRTVNGWSEPVALPFNSKEYSIGHPALSTDGNTLIFASDMPGGKGGVDLYKVTRTNGIWSAPVNLEAINTSGDELFPFIHEGGVLIFASNGHPGYGGLDLFAGQWKDNTIKRFQNLGSPVNSAADDFSIWMDPAMTRGYFASNRTGGKGSDDLYSFTMAKPLSFGRTLTGLAKDEKGELLPGTKIVFKDNSGNLIGETIAAADGSYRFETEKSGDFTLAGSRTNYFDGKETLKIAEDAPDALTKDIILEKDPGFALLAVVTDKKSKTPIEGVKMILTNNLTGMSETIQTNEKGEVLRPIRDKKINDRVSYNIRLEKNGYLSKTTTYNRLLDKEGKYVVSDELNLGMDKMDVGLDLAKAVDLKPIYFDLAKFNIRADAALELDKIVLIMNENPTMVVELGSHTDCRGTAAKNQELSQKRAMASADYIKKRIVNPDRIYGMGYGESKIINGCVCEGKNNPKYTEAQHQVNRRTEFVIVRM